MKKLLGFLLMMILCVGVSGCKNSTNFDSEYLSENDTNEYPWGFTSDEYVFSIDLGEEDTIIERAEDICNGKMWVHSSFNEAFDYELDEIDWDIVLSTSPGTYQLYLQALYPIVYLSEAYYFTEKEEYLDYARLLIENWMKYKNSPESDDNPYVWYDHGTALRVDNLIFFLLAYTEAGKLDDSFRLAMSSLLEEHGVHLSDMDEYTANHNHGIFQDQALIYLAYFLNNESKEEWLELALERLQEQESYAFNEEKVHVENSPGYQIGVADLFNSIANFLQTMGNDFGDQFYGDVIDSLEFMAWMTKPNGALAEVGDTSSTVSSNSKKYNNQHYIYAQLKGADGTKPTTNSTIYPISGYYFGRESWNPEDFVQTTWTMFKAGYSSKTHKHADDGSFMLYAKGYDIFVDPGWYNYMSGAKERDYFISSGAHNTVIVDDKSYSPTVENSSKTGIYEYELGEEYDYVIGYNNMYDGVQIDRHFFYMDNAIVLYDDIISEKEHVYSQMFHTSEYTNIEYADDDEVLLSIADTDYKVRIRQFSDDVILHVINGETADAGYGYISRQMNHLDTINTLKFEKQGTNVSYITVITIEDAEGNVAINRLGESVYYDDITYNDAEHMFTVISNGRRVEIPLKKRERPDFDRISVTCDKEQLLVDINDMSTEIEGWSYAYYLINYDSGSIQKMDYTLDTRTAIETNDEAVYLLKAYIKTPNGRQRESKILGAYQYKDGVFKDVSQNYPYLNLEYLGHHMEQISEKTFRFYVDYNYSWNSTIAFYIYKDGGGYDYSMEKDKKYLEYTFKEPGAYTIMYYLKTTNGDNEFWNFEQVEVAP